MLLHQRLSQISLFSHLNIEAIQRIMAAGLTRTYTSGEYLVHHGDVWPYLFFVIKGEIAAVKVSLEGRSLILETIREGDVFWGLAFFLEDAPMPAALKASLQSEIFLWPRHQLLPLLLKDGQISWELSRLALQRALRASEIVDELAFQPVAERLASFLVNRFEEPKGERVARDLTLDEMAAHIGTTREMVCRILQRFSNQGLIEITRTEFIFTDRLGLNQLARKNNERN
jgi:CRP-like cAMP-binding protein